MDTQILKLDAPYEYIYCNGSVGQHVATLIVMDTQTGDDGDLQLTTHSYPIVKYWNSPRGVVWDKAELADCYVLCDDTDKRVDICDFNLMVYALYEEKIPRDGDQLLYSEIEEDQSAIAYELKNKLVNFGIGFKMDDGSKELSVYVDTMKDEDDYFILNLEPETLPMDNINAHSKQEALSRLKDERDYWEDFYGNVVKIKFRAQGCFPEEVEAL